MEPVTSSSQARNTTYWGIGLSAVIKEETCKVFYIDTEACFTVVNGDYESFFFVKWLRYSHCQLFDKKAIDVVHDNSHCYKAKVSSSSL